MNYIENNDSSGSNGNRGKFTDRLKKIRRDRLSKRYKKDNDDTSDEIFIVRFGRNIFKVLLSVPMVVYSVIKPSKQKKELTKGNASDIILGIENIHNSRVNDIKYDRLDRRIRVTKISEIDIKTLKKQCEIYTKKSNKKTNNMNIFNNDDVLEKEDRIKKLQKEIIDLIKKKLVTNINELEILHSELFLLKEINDEDIYLEKCQDDIKEVKKLLSKINSLKAKYDYLKDNIDFEYLLEYGDDILVDKILELKELCSLDDIRYVVDNYKILEEYKFLYLKIDKLQENIIMYSDYKNESLEKLKERDIDFDKITEKVVDVDKEKEKYERFVKEQELMFMNLDEKILKIDSHEEVSCKIRGFNQLLSNSFKYLGLLLLSPLKGVMPGIASQTVITKNMIQNLYSNLSVEESRKMVYDAKDFTDSLNFALNNIDNMLLLVNSTLDDIVKLKDKYNSDFRKYGNSFSNYRDTIKKLNKIENAVMGSKIKIELMYDRTKEKQKQNSNKLKMVKKLNETSNNSKKIA